MQSWVDKLVCWQYKIIVVAQYQFVPVFINLIQIILDCNRDTSNIYLYKLLINCVFAVYTVCTVSKILFSFFIYILGRGSEPHEHPSSRLKIVQVNLLTVLPPCFHVGVGLYFTLRKQRKNVWYCYRYVTKKSGKQNIWVALRLFTSPVISYYIHHFVYLWWHSN